MGALIDGRWVREDQFPTGADGAFLRADSVFRDWVTGDGSSPFPAEPERYRLYLSLACPWAHRTLIFRRLKRLEDAIPVTGVDPYMGPDGWEFTGRDECGPDPELGATYLRELYQASRDGYTGRVTTPFLWDRKTRTIINNESADIVRMLNRAFDAFGDPGVDFHPPHLAAAIDEVNADIYQNVNNGVYECGFARSQQAYDRAFEALFRTLDALEARLSRQRYLVGDRVTEADWRLFVTLIRFDAVYVSHFKCNQRRIADYPNLSNYTRELYQVAGVAGTTSFAHIKEHYYRSHGSLNPGGVVPKGPVLDFDAAHDRGRLPEETLKVA